MSLAVTVEFSDHVSDQQRRLVLSFLNALSGTAEFSEKSTYTFVVSRQSNIEKARETLSEWEREGIIRWSQAEARQRRCPSPTAPDP